MKSYTPAPIRILSFLLKQINTYMRTDGQTNDDSVKTYGVDTHELIKIYFYDSSPHEPYRSTYREKHVNLER